MSATDKSDLRDQPEVGDLHVLIDILSPLAEALDPPPLCWIGNGGDEGLNYCPTCCRALVDTSNFMMARALDDEWFVDGGWDDARECDGPAACGSCGCTLGYSLTSYGASEELEAFQDVISNGFEPPLRDEDAYAVRAVLDAAVYGSAETIAAAVAIGEAAVAALAQVAA